MSGPIGQPGRCEVDGLRAVLFDMDGTLTDSERLWTIALERVARSYGGTLSRSAREAMVGQDIWNTIDLLQAELGLRMDPRRTAAELNSETKAVFRAGLPFKPGARELLAAVRAAGLATALVTATHRPLVDIAMHTLGGDNFDVSVAGDEVLRNKPDPQPYLRAVELLGLDTRDCLAIEDSPAGSASAAAAGIPTLVVPSEMPVPAGPGRVQATTLAGLTVHDLAEFRWGLLEPAPAG